MLNYAVTSHFLTLNDFSTATLHVSLVLKQSTIFFILHHVFNATISKEIFMTNDCHTAVAIPDERVRPSIGSFIGGDIGG